MIDQKVTVTDAPSGKAIEVAEISHPDDSVTERQRVVLSDSAEPNSHARVDGESGRGKLLTADDPMLVRLNLILETLEDIKDLLDEFVHS